MRSFANEGMRGGVSEEQIGIYLGNVHGDVGRRSIRIIIRSGRARILKDEINNFRIR